jgi:hypothetical protein
MIYDYNGFNRKVKFHCIFHIEIIIIIAKLYIFFYAILGGIKE